MRRKEIIDEARSVVVKIGSAVLFDSTRAVDRETVGCICRDIARLSASGRRVAVVSSGAIACGSHRLGWTRRPETLPKLQAAAAVGQSMLMEMYEGEFSRHNLHAGQMLLTRDDLDDRSRYLNAANTLRALFDAGGVPVVNENDTVSVDEIRFGENDVLSALVANMISADLLVMLSTVDGLHEDYGTKGRRGRLIHEVEGVDSAVLAHATGDTSSTGAGGMASKLEAAAIVTASGGAALIANGKEDRILQRIFEGEEVGTLFYPTRGHMKGRKRWIGFGARAKGEVVVDEGAAKALRERGKSLLPSGITSVSGEFSAGDVVSVRAKGADAFARGVVSYSSSEIRKIKGARTSRIASILGEKLYDEVIHRDNMTLL